MIRNRSIHWVGLAMLMLCETATAQTFDLSWSTVDGGGAIFSTNGGFSLGGTIGQHDAGPAASIMTAGSFTLAGGFWVAAVPACGSCPGDLNIDSRVNGIDIQAFVNCVLNNGNLAGCDCADLNDDGTIDVADVAPMAEQLLGTGICP